MKSHAWLWGLYDFANSLANITISFYFVLWFVSDLGGEDILVSGAVALTTVFLLCVQPFLGAVADRSGKRLLFFRWSSVLCAILLATLGIVALSQPEPRMISKGLVILCFAGFQLFYQSSLAFYSSFIDDVSARKTKEGVSGLGMALGQLGNIVGLIVMLPVAENFGRSSVFLVAAGLFLIASLPTLIFLKESPSPRTAVMPSWKSTWIKLRQQPNVLRYLVTYYFFADAVLTLQLFVALYLQEVGGLSDKMKTLTMVVGLLFAVIGALFSARFARRLKSTKRAISWLIALWVVFLVALAVSSSTAMFIVVTILNGAAFGALFALSRAYYAQLIPKHEYGEFFGIYVLFERASSVLGPLVWSAVIAGFAFAGTDRYRYAMFSLAAIVAISYFCLRTVKEPSYADSKESAPTTIG